MFPRKYKTRAPFRRNGKESPELSIFLAELRDKLSTLTNIEELSILKITSRQPRGAEHNIFRALSINIDNVGHIFTYYDEMAEQTFSGPRVSPTRELNNNKYLEINIGLSNTRMHTADE